MQQLTILFQGDSLTDGGRDKSVNECNKGLGNGFVYLIAGRILCDNPGAKIYNRGVNGNRIGDMYARWQEDALNIPFNVISIMNGINDVGFGIRLNCGAGREKYKFVYDRILYETKEKNPDCDIILCEPVLIKHVNEKENDIYENWDLWSGEISERASIVKELAEKYSALFVEFTPAIKKALEMAPAEHWSADCIHMTCAGNELLARAWLEQTEGLLKKYF